MFKNRFIVVLGVLSLLMVTLAVSRPFSNTAISDPSGATDFHQRHPEWRIEMGHAVVPVTGISELTDYYQRHPELRVPADVLIDQTDYFMRHPELRTSLSVDLTDYFQRHPEQKLP